MAIFLPYKKTMIKITYFRSSLDMFSAVKLQPCIPSVSVKSDMIPLVEKHCFFRSHYPYPRPTIKSEIKINVVNNILHFSEQEIATKNLQVLLEGGVWALLRGLKLYWHYLCSWCIEYYPILQSTSKRPCIIYY